LNKKQFVIDPHFARLYGIPLNVKREECVTGQVMFQKSSQQTPTNDETNRQLMIIFGVVAVPKDFSIEDHIQYPALGQFEENMFKDLNLQISLNEGIKPNLETKGVGVAGLLKSPIWRV
jgi:hypothetical protein